MRPFALLALIALGAAACSGDDNSTSSIDTVDTTPATTVAASTSAAQTTAAPTTLAATTSLVVDTTGPDTTAGGATTTAGCTAPTETVDVSENFPSAPSVSVYGDDIDTGGHDCFERIVINLAGTGDMPGYSVGYLPDPLKLASSGEPTALKGEANLVIRVGAWMGPEGAFDGERQLFPKNVDKIREVNLIDNFEGVMIWGIGLDTKRAFEVFELTEPLRLVIDISTVE